VRREKPLFLTGWWSNRREEIEVLRRGEVLLKNIPGMPTRTPSMEALRNVC